MGTEAHTCFGEHLGGPQVEARRSTATPQVGQWICCPYWRAARAMAPYLAKGAAQSLEDGACLAECLKRAEQIEEVPALLRSFETIRKPRCEIVQKGARSTGDIWHLPSSPAQELRDRNWKRTPEDMRAGAERDGYDSNCWNDPEFQHGFSAMILSKRYGMPTPRSRYNS